MATGIPVTVGELVDTATINTWARGLLRKTTGKAVNTTTSAVDLLNGEFTLPAGAMGIDRIVRLTAWGNWKQDSGAARDIPLFQLLLGGTTMIDTNKLGGNYVAQSPTRHGWRLQCEIQNTGATNTQQAFLSGNLTTLLGVSGDYVQSIGFTTGNGVVVMLESAGGPGVPALISYQGGAVNGTDFTGVDTTVACALVLNVKNASNNANYETKLLGALCEVI